MRLWSIGDSNERDELAAFADWIASIEDGTLRGKNDGFSPIDIPNDLLLEPSDDPVAKIVESTFPMFKNATDDPSYLKDRAILAPTLDIVESINEYMSSLNLTERRTYLCSYSTCKSDSNTDFVAQLHTHEFLNTIKCSGTPNHELNLKVGTSVMLLRNMNH
ncbi:PIF1 helicase [Striga hermonthica]|uniref:PIF1 helicase n=1 Tax=Striga hermonthica TaxID=68872 RepID=A0A9N7N2P9_STRHE|nr:PIF1 helicase [Striga hermonthica]